LTGQGGPVRLLHETFDGVFDGRLDEDYIQNAGGITRRCNGGITRDKLSGPKSPPPKRPLHRLNYHSWQTLLFRFQDAKQRTSRASPFAWFCSTPSAPSF
jgi:hypothetical protein